MKCKEIEVDGVRLTIKRPSGAILQRAEIVKVRAYGAAIRAGFPPTATVALRAIEQNLWSPEKNALCEKLQSRLRNSAQKLADPSTPPDEARAVATQMHQDRSTLRLLTKEMDELEATTANTKGEQAKFEYLVSKTVFDASGRPYFKDAEEYRKRATEKIAFAAATAVAEVAYRANLTRPETKVLSQ